MMGMKETVSNIVTSQAEKGGVKHVYYVACGGSYAAFYPAKAFLEKEAKALTVGLYNSGEFINNPPVALGENAVVVVASHKGNTPETIKAAEIARQHGAPVIGLTWIMDSPLVAHCDYVETYTFGDGKDIAGENDERPAECGRTAPADGRVCALRRFSGWRQQNQPYRLARLRAGSGACAGVRAGI